NEQSERLVERTCVTLRSGRCEQPICPASGFGRQLGGALMERCSGGQASTALSAIGRALQLAGDILIRLGCRLCSMPGVSIGVNPRIDRLAQGAVHGPALLERRRTIGRGSHQWMTKAHTHAELQ